MSTVRDQFSFGFQLQIIVVCVFGEAPFVGDDDALLARKFEFGASKALNRSR
jgi:hypothetical protein